MNYGSRHNITPDNWNFNARIDTVMVEKFIGLDNVARALNVNISDLALLNPAYKRQIINGTKALPRRLIIPRAGQRNYTALYNVLNGVTAPVIAQQAAVVEHPMNLETAVPVAATTIIATTSKLTAQKAPDFYTTKEGDTLETIADNYGLDVREIKAWNRLQTNKVGAGKKLKLNPFAKVSRG
jgi:membrane-bound lytic murein transglycosylase D